MDLANEKNLNDIINHAINRMLERQRRNREVVRYIKTEVNSLKLDTVTKDECGDKHQR